MQIAQLINSLPETQRTLAEVREAAADLDAAIDSFDAIAQSPQTPYPKHDIEQRANMGRNTMRRQMERAVQTQKEYEDRNREKLEKAREVREKELKRREDLARKAEEEANAEEAGLTVIVPFRFSPASFSLAWRSSRSLPDSPSLSSG